MNPREPDKQTKPRNKLIPGKYFKWMKRNTKYTVGMVAVLIIFAVVSIALLYNRDKQNQTGDAALNKTQLAKQKAQYSTPKVPITEQMQTENATHLVINSFLKEYLANKNGGKSQDAILAKYGTSNLVNQYHSVKTGSDLILCDSLGEFTTATTSGNFAKYGDPNVYSSTLSNSKSETLNVQLKVSGQGATALIDYSACPAPI